jgi:DNA-binding MarR family transcriptional regulator
VNSEARHELGLLEALEQDGHVTQRRLASKLGMAVGLTNIYLKRLVRKGYVKCVNLQSNRLLYLLTPSGVAEKTRLTYEYMEYSLRLYRDARLRVRAVLAPLASNSNTRVAIYGTGEPAELAYMVLKELSLEPVAIFENLDNGRFFDLPVHRIADHSDVAFDVLIIATLDDPAPALAILNGLGITRDRLVTLRHSVVAEA